MHSQLKIRAPAKALVSLPWLRQALSEHHVVPDQMRDTLQSCIHHADMASFFRRCLPSLWTETLGDTQIHKQEEGCERQDQLLRALSQRLPIWLDFEWSYAGMSPGLPLETSGVDWSDYSDVEDLGQFRPAFVVLGYLAGMLDKDIALEYVADHGLPIVLPDVPAGSCAFEWFKRQCQRSHQPTGTSPPSEAWCDLPAALELAGLSTGNALLDTTFEERHLFDEWLWDLGWTRKALRCAERMSKQADQIQQAMARALDWLERDPEVWPHVFALWIEAHRRYKPKPPVVRVISSQDFVSGEVFRRR